MRNSLSCVAGEGREGCYPRCYEPLQPVDRVVAALELRIVDDPLVQRDRGLDADDGEFVQRAAQAVDRVGARRRMHDQLRHQAVVVRRHEIAGVQRRIDAHAEPARRVERGDAARRRHEGRGILGVDAALDGVAGEA